MRAAAAAALRGLPAARRAAAPPQGAAAPQLQVLRGMVLGADHDKQEPAASPWIRVVERPGGGSEAAPTVPEGQAREAPDVPPEQAPEAFPQAPILPEVLKAAEANPSQDSVRFVAGALNKAAGGGADFPETGGSTLRDMASEIGHNVAAAAGLAGKPEGAAARVAQGAEDATLSLEEFVERVSQNAGDAAQGAKEAASRAAGAAGRAVEGAAGRGGEGEGEGSKGLDEEQQDEASSGDARRPWQS